MHTYFIFCKLLLYNRYGTFSVMDEVVQRDQGCVRFH